ncbi:hypothetical protein [Methylobacterium sp. Leaf85]|uniref:hypothetical protein n=1 Tax=Methylobacterium sp. Leaf85 TaxID=1736241 RepID=UPI0006FD3798|nr:hypothetical protein [Methylobacterium sp. Leaf85]KQO53099.1 hypothetical protein ASF08_19435 [Methylobacterium sp. Leaf85]
MSSALIERLIAALTDCPCCRSDVRVTNTPDDGIPDHCILEKVFDCGAAVFVTNSGDYEAGQACPDPLDGALLQLQEEVMEAAEDEDVAS